MHEQQRTHTTQRLSPLRALHFHHGDIFSAAQDILSLRGFWPSALYCSLRPVPERHGRILQRGPFKDRLVLVFDERSGRCHHKLPVFRGTDDQECRSEGFGVTCVCCVCHVSLGRLLVLDEPWQPASRRAGEGIPCEHWNQSGSRALVGLALSTHGGGTI